MEESVKERLKLFLKESKIKGTDFCESIGVSSGFISGMRESIQPDKLKSIAIKYPDLNIGWLMTGQGDMLQPKISTQFQSNAKILENAGFMNVPLIHVRAQCGYLSGYGDNEYINSLPTMPVIVDKTYHGKYMLFEAEGDSMDDNTRNALCDGDIVLGREIQRHLWEYKLHINDWYFIIVHRTDGISIKKITDHDVESGVITCHPLNDLYKDYKVHLNDVVELYNLVKIVDRSARL